MSKRDADKTRDNFVKLFVKRFGTEPRKGVLIKFNLRAYCAYHDRNNDVPVNANTHLVEGQPDMVEYQVAEDPFYEWGRWLVLLKCTNKKYPLYMQQFAICQAELKQAFLWKEG